MERYWNLDKQELSVIETLLKALLKSFNSLLSIEHSKTKDISHVTVKKKKKKQKKAEVTHTYSL